MYFAASALKRISILDALHCLPLNSIEHSRSALKSERRLYARVLT